MTQPTLQILAERIVAERELREQSERYVDLALRLQASEYERRLTVLNHAHERATAAQAATVPREMFDSYIKESRERGLTVLETVNTRIDAVEKAGDIARGKGMGVGMAAAVIVSAIGLMGTILGAVILVANFVTGGHS